MIDLQTEQQQQFALRDFKRKLHAIQIEEITGGLAPELVEQLRKEQKYTEVKIDWFKKFYAKQLSQDKLLEVRALKEEIDRLRVNDSEANGYLTEKEARHRNLEWEIVALKSRLDQQDKKNELAEDFEISSKKDNIERESINSKRAKIRARTVATVDQSEKERAEIEKLKIWKAQLMAEVAIYHAMIGQKLGDLDFPIDGFEDELKTQNSLSSEKNSSISDWINRSQKQHEIPLAAERRMLVETESHSS